MFLPKGRYVIIKVIDDGSGIRKEHLGRVFDPYFTTRQSGTGLGLTTAFSIIKNHGGYLDIASEEGDGTTVTIYLHAENKNGHR
jgi:signal transduction histidine kinase